MPIKRLSQSSLLTFEKYSSMLAGNESYVPGLPNSYEWLETQILTSNQTSITFSNLNTNYSSTYQHLQLRIVARTDRGDTDDFIMMRFNGDSGNNYTSHNLRGNGSNVQSSNPRTNYQNIEISAITASTQTANSFGAGIIDILDPFETTKNTTIRATMGLTGTYNFVGLVSGFWNSTAAVNTIFLDQFFGSIFVTGSRFSLYGMKG
jgi:hypothetical protein